MVWINKSKMYHIDVAVYPFYTHYDDTVVVYLIQYLAFFFNIENAGTAVAAKTLH